MMRWMAAALVLLSSGLAQAAEPPIQVMAAGSLRGAMTELADAFSQRTGIAVETRFASAGLLHDRIEKGEKADLFASADLAAPQALADESKADPVVTFARNGMCAYVRPGLAVTPATLLDTLLDPKIVVGTSTPKADPGGDYAWAIFARAEAVRPGSGAALEAKARRFLDRPNPAKAPDGANPLAWVLGHGQADLFIAYCSGGKAVLDQLPGATSVEIPPALAVTPQFGLTVLAGGSQPAAARFALFILSKPGRDILIRNGFEAP